MNVEGGLIKVGNDNEFLEKLVIQRQKNCIDTRGFSSSRNHNNCRVICTDKSR